MGFEIKIKEIILEIEYLLVILLIVSGLSDTIMSFFDKYYICLLFILFHELSHVFVGALLNKRLFKMFIGISGATAFFKYNYLQKDRLYYFKETVIFLAGPMSNVLVAYLFKDINFIFEINIFLGILNLLPIYPLDGFNILKNLLITLFINNKNIINSIMKIISITFVLVISIICIIIFFNYNNVFSIIFLVYILFINIQKT